MREVVLVGAVRTAIGSFGGGLAGIPVIDLGVTVVRAALERSGIPVDQVDELIFGNVLQAGLGQNPARQVAVKAGIPIDRPSFAVNKLCGSGLKAVALAAQAVAAGDADVVVAGGMESMSNAPYVLPSARWGKRMGDDQLIDTMVLDGLTCAFNQYHMGVTAENVAEKYGLTRADQDAFAARSQQRAEQAIKEGRFEMEIVPVLIPQRKGEPKQFKVDEFPRQGTTAEGLGGLNPAFKKGGTVTAGNASGINDGAAAVVVLSADKARELRVTPMAVVRSYATAGVDPALMGTGPIPASRKALQKAGLTIAEMDLVEANEAFAAQALAVCRDLNLDPDKTNVNGGAIALGHPIGASGARVLVTLLAALQLRNQRFGLATLCIGGGQGVAMVVERA